MFSRMKITESIKDSSERIRKLKNELEAADAIVIGAGAGLSAAAGLTYGGERFRKHFSDFEKKYGFHDMYSGGFYPYETLEEHWAYWSRNILVNRYMDAPKPVYSAFFELVKNKDYFVISTNVDSCFQKAGFNKERLFYTQGDYGLFQCSEPCCDETFENEALIRQMVREQADMRVPSELLPQCPRCGKPMTMNLRSDHRFVEDERWRLSAQRYKNFMQAWAGRHILLLELGVGYNTPVIIKYPFWRITAQNPQAVYACINAGEAVAPQKISSQSICVNADIAGAIRDML